MIAAANCQIQLAWFIKNQVNLKVHFAVAQLVRGPICIEPKHFLYNLPTFLRNVSSIAILLVCLFRELYVLCALHAELCISIQFVVFTLGGRTFSYKLEVHNVQKYKRKS